MHELDKKAFEALNRFPKLVKLQEAYLANYDEKRAKIQFLSTGIRLSQRQKPEVYDLLPSICNKLGINIPDLYMVQSRDKKDLNAFTCGAREPIVCVTSELIKQCTPEMVSTVIAHECGHIACKHVLYHAIASSFYQGFENSPLYDIPIIRKYISPALIRAILFWDRCSELSADRAAVLCDGGSEKTIDMLLKIHGFEDDINREEFIKQSLDLKDFVNQSDVNKTMDMMINQWNSHPLLATRAYECYEWANSDQFKGIISGSFTIKDKEKEASEKTEEEVISADVSFEDKKNNVVKEVPPEVEQALNDRLRQVNAELDRYTNKADKVQYAYSIACGIISGWVDSMFFADAEPIKLDMPKANRNMNEFIGNFAKHKGIGEERLNKIIEKLEKQYPVLQDNIYKGVIDGVVPKNHHLADLAHHPTPAGLISAILVNFFRFGTFVNKDGKWKFQFVPTTPEDIIKLAVPAVITGILNWLVYIGEEKYEEETGKELPKAIHNLAHVIASTPEIIEVIKCIDNWFGHLVSDMGGSKNTAGEGMGIPGVFMSLVYELGALPILKDTGITNWINDLYVKGKIDMREELGFIYSLDPKQIVPVAFNELFVRIGFSLLQLEKELINHRGFKGIDWNSISPIGNRSVDRCLAIAHMTLNVVDTADAAMRAAIESGGNWVIFSGRFVARYNYVGAARAALAIVKEVSNEKKETQLIHERMLLMDAKAQIMYQQLQQFKAQLDEKLANYLAEDIEAFIEGFDYMKQGLANNNSDLVIKGNVTIQKVLGREPQFTTQREFDELMESDEAFQF